MGDARSGKAAVPVIDRILRRGRSTAPETLTSVDAYALWAATYPPTAHNPLMQVEGDAVTSLLPDVRGAVALDLASGTGRYGLVLRERGARVVMALDNSPDMLLANAIALKALSTCEAIPLASGTVDVIVCGMALGHLPRLEPSMNEISRVLTTGGVAIISDFHPILHFTGARRTFSANGSTYAVEHYAHLYADYHRTAWDAGLRIEDVREPSITGHGNGMPVALVMRMGKRLET